MKFTQRAALCIFAIVAPQFLNADAQIPCQQDQFALIFHLFEPLHQHSQKGIAQLRKDVELKVHAGQDYNSAFNEEVRKFLVAQLTEAFEIIARLQNTVLDQDSAHSLAEMIIQEKLEKAFAARFGKQLFEQNPATLPAHIFTYFVTPYFVEQYKDLPLPEFNRFDISSVMFYLHTLRVGLNYADQIIDYSNKVLDTLGVPKANAHIL